MSKTDKTAPYWVQALRDGMPDHRGHIHHDCMPDTLEHARLRQHPPGRAHHDQCPAWQWEPVPCVPATCGVSWSTYRLARLDGQLHPELEPCGREHQRQVPSGNTCPLCDTHRVARATCEISLDEKYSQTLRRYGITVPSEYTRAVSTKPRRAAERHATDAARRLYNAGHRIDDDDTLEDAWEIPRFPGGAAQWYW